MAASAGAADEPATRSRRKALETHDLEDQRTLALSLELYHHLWTTDSADRSCPLVQLPETIVFLDHKPHEWYFMSRDGRIRRKSPENLTSERILEAFLRPASTRRKCECIAMLLVPVASDTGATNRIRFFDARSLRLYLSDERAEARPKRGLLQQFVHPYTASEAVTRVQWSPHDVQVESRVNVYRLDAGGVPESDKLATYFAPAHLAVTTVAHLTLSNALRDRLMAATDSVVSHVRAVTETAVAIRSVDLYFKVGSCGAIWLLFAAHVDAVATRERVVRTAPTATRSRTLRVSRRKLASSASSGAAPAASAAATPGPTSGRRAAARALPRVLENKITADQLLAERRANTDATTLAPATSMARLRRFAATEAHLNAVESEAQAAALAAAHARANADALSGQMPAPRARREASWRSSASAASRSDTAPSPSPVSRERSLVIPSTLNESGVVDPVAAAHFDASGSEATALRGELIAAFKTLRHTRETHYRLEQQALALTVLIQRERAVRDEWLQQAKAAGLDSLLDADL